MLFLSASTLGMYGEGDFFTMKGVVQAVLNKLGLNEMAEYKVCFS